MSQLDRTSLAKFRILVSVAMADGVLQASEEQVLRGALGPHAELLTDLLAEDIDVDAEIAMLDAVDRRVLYQSAFALANADGHAQTFEVAILNKLVPNRGEDGLLSQVLGETLDTVLPSRILAEANPVKRDAEISEDTLKYAVLSAVAAATPVPGLAVVADLAVVVIQAKLVHDIGLYWGHDLDRKSIQGFLGTAAGSIGLRIAVNNLARFVPGWGSAFAAGTSFATTYAVGMAANTWFASGRQMGSDELSEVFKTAQVQGREAFGKHGQDIDEAKGSHGDRLAALNEQFANEEIDRVTYEARLLEL